MRVLYVALTRAQDALLITVPLKKTASSLKLPALCAAAEATGPEAMRSMTSWAGWILTAALLHPDSSALWEYTSFLPHYGLHRAPLAIPRAAPAGGDRTAARTARPRGRPGSGGNAEGQLCLAQSARGAGKGARQGQRQRRGPRGAAVALERPAFLQKTGMTGAERGTAIHAFIAERAV